MSVETVIPGKKYRIRWREGGRQRSKTYFGTERQAHVLDDQIDSQLRSGTTPSAGKTTIRELGNEFFRRRGRTWSDKTLDGYTQTWRSCIDNRIGDVSVERATLPRLEDWIAEMDADGVGRESQRKALLRLRTALDCAVDWGYIQKNWATRVPMPPPPDSQPPYIPSPVQVEQMRKYWLDRKDKKTPLIFSLIAYQGLRPGEVFGLCAEQVKEGSIMIRQSNVLKLEVEQDEDGEEVLRKRSKVAKRTKTNQYRVVKLNKHVAVELAEYMLANGLRGKDLLFPLKGGGLITPTAYGNWRRNKFNPAKKAAGALLTTPYKLRHAYASLLFWSGKQVTHVAAQLGHSPAVCLRHYLHVISELEDSPQVSVFEAIENARAEVRDDASEAVTA